MRVLYVASRLHPNYTDSLRALTEKYELSVLVAFQVDNERHEKLSVSHFPDGPFSRLLTLFHRRAGLSPEQVAYRKRHPSLLWLIRFIRMHRIDVIYARRDNKHLLRTAWLAAQVTSCRFVSYRQQIFNPAGKMDKKAIYPLTVASENRQHKNYIPLTIDLSRLQNIRPLPRYKSVNGEPLRIMAVGKLIERKGHQLLIEAVAQLRGKLSIQVNIYGDYSSFHSQQYARQLEEMIQQYKLQDCVKLMPRIAPDSMIDEYAKHHLFVYSGWVGAEQDPEEDIYNRANGYCGTRLYSLLEAMAVGLPVISSAEKYVVGAIDNKVNGLVFEKRNAADLAVKIEAISQMDLVVMGARSRTLICEHYESTSFPRLFNLFLNNR